MALVRRAPSWSRRTRRVVIEPKCQPALFCEFCGIEVDAKRHDQRFCCVKCRVYWHRAAERLVNSSPPIDERKAEVTAPRADPRPKIGRVRPRLKRVGLWDMLYRNRG